MHPATHRAFFEEMQKIAQDHIDDAQEKADNKRRSLKGAALGAGAIGAGIAGHHYAKKGLAAAKAGITDAVQEGIKKGTKGALWNALKLR